MFQNCSKKNLISSIYGTTRRKCNIMRWNNFRGKQSEISLNQYLIISNNFCNFFQNQDAVFVGKSVVLILQYFF